MNEKPRRLKEIKLKHDSIVTSINGYIEAGHDVYISMAPMKVSYLVAKAIDTSTGPKIQFVDSSLPPKPVRPGDTVTIHVAIDRGAKGRGPKP